MACPPWCCVPPVVLCSASTTLGLTERYDTARSLNDNKSNKKQISVLVRAMITELAYYFLQYNTTAQSTSLTPASNRQPHTSTQTF